MCKTFSRNYILVWAAERVKIQTESNGHNVEGWEPQLILLYSIM